MYREVDEYTHREFVLTAPVKTVRSNKSTIELVPSKDFGEIIFMDGELQLAEKDEYIYHEMLIHPIMSLYSEPVTVCILGGGDGCAAREVLQWPIVQSLDIYDWDEGIVQLFRNEYRSWNKGSLLSSKTTVFCQDVRTIEKKYDVIIVDLIDPNYKNEESKRLWEELISKLPSLLKPTSSLVINAGGFFPWDFKNIEWQLFLLSSAFSQNETHTLQSYKVYVPSFDKEWCLFFIRPFNTTVKQSSSRFLRYYDENAWILATTWTKDVSRLLPIQPTKLKGYLPPL